jgi:hypothetical protein
MGGGLTPGDRGRLRSLGVDIGVFLSFANDIDAIPPRADLRRRRFEDQRHPLSLDERSVQDAITDDLQIFRTCYNHAIEESLIIRQRGLLRLTDLYQLTDKITSFLDRPYPQHHRVVPPTALTQQVTLAYLRDPQVIGSEHRSLRNRFLNRSALAAYIADQVLPPQPSTSSSSSTAATLAEEEQEVDSQHASQ